jgi:hypothetical protein
VAQVLDGTTYLDLLLEVEVHPLLAELHSLETVEKIKDSIISCPHGLHRPSITSYCSRDSYMCLYHHMQFAVRHKVPQTTYKILASFNRPCFSLVLT